MTKTSAIVKYNWSPKRYIQLVEKTNFPMLREYQREELDYTRKIKDLQDKTIIDVGAGYGRVLPQLADIARNVIAIELDEQMFEELSRRAKRYKNVTAINGNGNNLIELLGRQNIKYPVLLSLQNSLGTWNGDYHKALENMKQVAEERAGEIIISLLRQEAFDQQAVPMYKTLEELVGEPDLGGTDVKEGIFRSKTGYKSQWWTKDQREETTRLLSGKKVAEILTPNFWIFHVRYPNQFQS